MRILAITSYKGTNYQGWQRQPNVMSVQERIEMELSKYFNRPINIVGSGRTDAGVHALGQRFHFDVDVTELDLDKTIYSLNCMLPSDIKIEDLMEVDEDFHARFSAIEKIYGYSIILSSKDVLLNDIMYVCPYKLDLKKFKETLMLFKGEHNFKNFTSKESDEDNFIREIYDITYDYRESTISISLRGNGFMRYMIRYIIGTAIEVARNKVDIEEVKELLKGEGERKIVSWKAPAQGLILLDVIYEKTL